MSVMPPLPCTIAGRSLFDGVRLRWGGVGATGVGIALLFTGEVGAVIFGLLLAALGVASLVLSSFGTRFWYDIPTPQRYVVGTGAVIGFVSLMGFVAGMWLVGTLMQAFGRNW